MTEYEPPCHASEFACTPINTALAYSSERWHDACHLSAEYIRQRLARSLTEDIVISDYDTAAMTHDFGHTHKEVTATLTTAQAKCVIAEGLPGNRTENIEHAIDLGHIYLRMVDMGHVEDYKRLIQDAAVMKYVGITAGELPTQDECEALVAGAVDAWRTRGYGRWSIFDSETNEFIGFSGFRCEEGVPELLIMVHRRYWGTGVARDAVRASVEYGFRNLSFDRVIAHTRPDNARARGLMKKVDATFTGYVWFRGVRGAAYEIMRSPAC